jgi:hypothetical protein
VALSGLPSRTDLYNQRPEHLLSRGQKERRAVQRRHSYMTQMERIMRINDLAQVTKDVVESARESLVIGPE